MQITIPRWRWLLPILSGTALALAACTSPKHTEHSRTLWVAGSKKPCSAGAGKMQCLQTSEHTDLATAQWTLFYAPIEGFNFQPGVAQHIRVQPTQLDTTHLPADVSSIRYTLLDTMTQHSDNPQKMNGDWVLVRLYGQPLNRAQTIPQLSIDLAARRVSGNNGCNRFNANIESVGTGQLQLSPLASTRMMCIRPNVEQTFNQAMGEVHAYLVNEQTLTLLNAQGSEILTFIPQ